MSDDFYAAVGSRIRALRERSGMSQGAFAAAAGMNERYAWRVEHGRQNLSLLTLGRAALALGVSPAAFFEGVEVDAAILEAVVRKNERSVGSATKDGGDGGRMPAAARYFVERRPDGRYGVLKPKAGRPSAIGDTQAEAIAKAKALDPGAVVNVERVPGVDPGRGRWRRI